MRRFPLILGGLLELLSADGLVGEGPAAPPVLPAAPAADARLSELVETIVREAIPRSFEDDRHWGRRERVVSGLDVEIKGLGLRISKRDAACVTVSGAKYTVTLIDPHKTLKLRIENVRSPAPGQFRCDLFVRLRANVDARLEHWNLGVKLFNTHADADATLEVHADCSLRLRLESNDAENGPLLVLQPTVHTVGLRLPDLDVNQFGAAKGAFAEELGDGLEEVVEELLQSQEKSIRDQAQRAIDRHADDFRIPLGDVLSSEWSKLLRF